MNTTITTLTLSAPAQLLRAEDASAAARFEDLLDLRQRAAARGYKRLEEWYADWIIDEMTGGYQMAAVAERFWRLVDRSAGQDACWPWVGSINRRSDSGYGQFSIGGRLFRAHRVADTLVNGPIPDGLHVLHHCDNRPCCNPTGDQHLFRGTQRDNIDDMLAKGRSAKGDRGGMRRHPEKHPPIRGERHVNAKLTADAVRAIRAVYAAGGVRQIDLAATYGVDQRTISKVVLGKAWGHLETAYTERIVDEVLSDAYGLAGPGGHAA